MKRAPHYIAVEGPLRVGKSRLVGALADSLHATQLLDVTDNPHLGDFYRGRPSAAFRAQMHFLLERARRIQAAQVDASRTPIVADFMLEKDKLFACICLDDAELAIYENYYQYFKRQAPQPDLTVYLKATAGALRARLATEKDGMEARVSDVYLEGAVQAYDHFFQHYRVPMSSSLTRPTRTSSSLPRTSRAFLQTSRSLSQAPSSSCHWSHSGDLSRQERSCQCP